MSLLFALTKQFTMFTHAKTMNQATWNFKLDTLMHEIEMHEHRDELIQLIREQVADDTSLTYG